MEIEFTYDLSVSGAPAAFKTALQAAANYLDNLIQNNITIDIEVGWGESGETATNPGSSIPSTALAEAAPLGSLMSYSQVVAELTKFATSADDKTLIANLPATDPTNGANFYVSYAQQEAWGLIPANSVTIDGVLGFSSSDPFSFDPNNRAVAGDYDFIGAAEHEITHAMGRFASEDRNPPGEYEIMDLFRYNSNHQLDMNGTSADFFSLDGGKTLLAPFDTNPNGDPGDWDQSVPNDSFGYGSMDQVESVSAVDIRLMDVLGYNVGAPALGSPPVIVSSVVGPLTVAGNGSLEPLLSVGVTDTEAAATETVKVVLSGPSGATSLGQLSDLAGGTFDAATNTFTATGSVPASGEDFAQVILDSLVYAPPTTSLSFVDISAYVTNNVGTATLGPLQVNIGPPFTPPPSAPGNFDILDTTTNASSTSMGDAYSGPIAGPQWQYVNITSDSLNITSRVANVFLHSGSGSDALSVDLANGNNILDGSTGSNFLVGGSGNDTFFVDDRGPGADIWSTVKGFHSGDNATVWGVTPTDFSLNTYDNLGAAGSTGLTFGFTAPGKPNVDLTLAGYTKADLSNGRLTVTYGTTPDEPGLPGSAYMLIHGN